GPSTGGRGAAPSPTRPRAGRRSSAARRSAPGRRTAPARATRRAHAMRATSDTLGSADTEMSTTRESGRAEGSRSVPQRTRAGALAAAACSALPPGRTRGGREATTDRPWGVVNQPVQGAQVATLSPVAGWALDDRGIQEIRLYIDGHFANTCRLSVARPDVSRSFPRYVRDHHIHGFAVLAGFDSPGPHTLVVQAVDTDGATRDIAVVNVIAIDK